MMQTSGEFHCLYCHKMCENNWDTNHTIEHVKKEEVTSECTEEKCGEWKKKVANALKIMKSHDQ